jgi:WD40 repeat protein
LIEAKNDHPVTDLATFVKDGKVTFATTTKSQSGTLWRLDKTQATVLAVLKGHSSEMECIDFNPLGNMLCSGSADNTIKIWETDGKTVKSDVPQSKKTKTHDARNLEIEPLGTLTGHQSAVSAIEWGSQGNVLLSGSYDHTIRLWDVVRAHPITTLSGNKVVTSVSFNQDLGLIVSGHPDHIIRTWDPRANETKPTLFKSHRSWVRQVQWGTQYQFLSGADDNMAKVWDIRSTMPLHSIVHSTEVAKGKQKILKWKAPKKVLAVAWSKSTDKKQLYTGSNDCTLKRHTY